MQPVRRITAIGHVDTLSGSPVLWFVELLNSGWQACFIEQALESADSCLGATKCKSLAPRELKARHSNFRTQRSLFGGFAFAGGHFFGDGFAGFGG